MSGTNHSGQPFDAPDPTGDGDGSQSENAPPKGGGVAPLGKHRSQTTGANENGSSQATGLNENGEQTVISQQSRLAQAESTRLPPQLTPNRLGPGDSLGHYELMEFVGGGGMGRVFRALDTKLDRHVAIKVLPCEQVADSETLQRFRNEAKSAARLNHDNIARAYDIGEDRGLSYLVFEFVEGTTIRDLVARHGPISLADSLSYTLQTADALSHAAGRGIVHRDVKPSNILITDEGQAKLIDMGLARIQMPHNSSDDLTATGVTLGTFDYISPEQARDPRIADVRSDIYSLGCTFFYMLTGRPPFPEGTVLQKLLQHQGDKPPNIQEFRPEMPDELSAVFGKLLAKDPNHRYQTPEELIEHLQLLAAQMGLRPLGPGQRSWIAAKRRRASFFQRHLPWMAPIGSLIVVWFFLRLYWTSTAQPPPLPPKTSVQSGDDAAVAAEVEQIPRIGSTHSDDATVEPALPNGVPSMVHAPKVPSGPTRPKHAVPPVETQAGPLGPLSPLDEFGEPGSFFDGLSFDAEGIPKISWDSEPFGNSWPDAKLPPIQPSGTIKPPEGSAALLTTADAPATGSPSSLAGVLVVDTVGKLSGTYSTLRAACNAAESGDIIELRYNGRREESPLTLDNVKFTIRAGKQFRPVIVFRPDPGKYSRSMFSLNGTRLTLLNLAVELDVLRAVPADEWSLFELGRAETVQLRKCSLTIRNALKKPLAYHENVAFFNIHADAADTALIEKPNKDSSKKSAQIELLDCIARGEAVLLRTKKLQPAHLAWKNGLLVTSEQMLDAEGAQQAPLPGDKIEIELQHLTAIVNGGLCRIGSGHSVSYQLPISINCTDSIIRSSLNRPLIEQTGGRGTSELQKLFSYGGDRNCYQDFNVFWSIDGNGPSTEPELIEWEAWQTRWTPDNERNSQWCSIDWKRLPEPSRMPHTMTQWDYELSESEENPTHSAASDGSDIGFNPRQLPRLPSKTKNSIEDKNP